MWHEVDGKQNYLFEDSKFGFRSFNPGRCLWLRDAKITYLLLDFNKVKLGKACVQFVISLSK